VVGNPETICKGVLGKGKSHWEWLFADKN